MLLLTAFLLNFAGYGKKDIQNIGFDDDVPPYGSGSQPAKPGASASRPSAARWQSWAARKTPVRPSVLDIERLQNARPVVGGGQKRPDQPLVFPMQGSSANASPASPPQGSENPPSSGWQPKPADGGSSVPGSNTGSDTKGVNNKPPVYGDVFKYPTQGGGAPQSQGNPPQAAGGSSQGSPPAYVLLQSQPVKGGARPFQPSRPVSSHQSGPRPYGGTVSRQQNPPNANQAPLRWDAEARPPVPPPSIIIQASSGYGRFSKTYRRSKYDPEFAVPLPGASPALQPAAQRYSHFNLNAFYSG